MAFFIEGGLTCIIAIASFYMTPDFPTTPASWLTLDEQMLAQRRIVEDVCTPEQKNPQRSGLVDALTDWTVWWLAIAGCSILVGVSFSLFFPTIVATMGYSPTMTLLLCSSLGYWHYNVTPRYAVRSLAHVLLPLVI